MSLRVLFEGSIAKHTEAPEDNEDAFCVLAGSGRIVLSDGASESFDARTWARLLVERLGTVDPSDKVIAACIQDYEQRHDQASLSWSKAAAYERGSFATLILVQDHDELNEVEVLAVGDSLAVWSDGTGILSTMPYERSAQFEDKPILLSTQPELNSTDETGMVASLQAVRWVYEATGYRLILCMTDALGAWLLRHEEAEDASAFERLSQIRELEELEILVEAERAAGRMRRDDATLVIALLTGTNSDGLSIT